MKQVTVKVYSTPSCPYCKLVKDYLKETKVMYEDVDVAANPSAANEMVKVSGQMGVPVIVINGEKVIVGWNKQALEEALGVQTSMKMAA